MNDLWIPIVLAICLTITMASYLYFSNKHKIEVQKTIREAFVKGDELSPEHIAQISNIKSSKHKDLRRGIILLSLGCAFILAGVITGFIANMSAVAMFPLMLGCGFIVTWKLNGDV
jgi:Ca2+/Na+ antiporter